MLFFLKKFFFFLTCHTFFLGSALSFPIAQPSIDDLSSQDRDRNFSGIAMESALYLTLENSLQEEDLNRIYTPSLFTDPTALETWQSLIENLKDSHAEGSFSKLTKDASQILNFQLSKDNLDSLNKEISIQGEAIHNRIRSYLEIGKIEDSRKKEILEIISSIEQVQNIFFKNIEQSKRLSLESKTAKSFRPSLRLPESLAKETFFMALSLLRVPLDALVAAKSDTSSDDNQLKKVPFILKTSLTTTNYNYLTQLAQLLFPYENKFCENMQGSFVKTIYVDGLMKGFVVPYLQRAIYGTLGEEGLLSSQLEEIPASFVSDSNIYKMTPLKDRYSWKKESANYKLSLIGLGFHVPKALLAGVIAGGVSELATKVLSEQQKKSAIIDFLQGGIIELLSKASILFAIEKPFLEKYKEGTKPLGFTEISGEKYLVYLKAGKKLEHQTLEAKRAVLKARKTYLELSQDEIKDSGYKVAEPVANLHATDLEKRNSKILGFAKATWREFLSDAGKSIISKPIFPHLMTGLGFTKLRGSHQINNPILKALEMRIDKSVNEAFENLAAHLDGKASEAFFGEIVGIIKDTEGVWRYVRRTPLFK